MLFFAAAYKSTISNHESGHACDPCCLHKAAQSCGDQLRCLCCVQGRFDPDNFTQEVADVAQKLVPLTVTLWNKVSAKMLPTPAKFHYLFNMRELSKVSSCVICSSTGLQQTSLSFQ